MSIRRCFFLLFVLVGFSLSSALQASTPYSQRDTSYFFRFDTGPFLVDPGFVETSQDGRVAVWDKGLQQYFFLNPGSSANQTDTGSAYTRYQLDELLTEFNQSRVVRRWGLSITPESFFGTDGRFWSYNARRSSQSGTVVLKSYYPTPRKLQLPGPVRSIVPSEDQWIIQVAETDTPLIRWDPYSKQGLVDTAPYSLEGTLIGVTQDGRYLTRHGNKIQTYRQGERIESRTFSSIIDVSVRSNNVYVLTGNREVTRLDSRLTAQYTFFLPRKRSYNSFAVHGNTLYLTSPAGLFRGVMDETGRSFFSQSSQLPLDALAKRFPVAQTSEPRHKLWIRQRDSGTRLLVKTDTSLVHELAYSGRELTRKEPQHVDDLSRTAFQYFQVDSTYWNGGGSLYYFFQSDRAVEQYDTQGRLIKRKRFSFSEFNNMRNLEFLGATAERVYFSAELIDSRRGFQRFVLKYDWQGDLIRSFRLQHPFSGKEYMSPSKGGSWRYLGGDNFYQLHSNSIIVFDRYGYPRQTLPNVSNPVDVARSNGTLFVLDLGGKRLRAFEVPDQPSRRYGLPSDIRIGDLATSRSGGAIVSGLTTGQERLGLYEYDLGSFDYQRVLSHPKQSLRYPLLTDGGDTLFFWGVNPSSDRWTLYRSDTVKYSARPLKQARDVAGTGFYSQERDLLFYPVTPRNDTGSNYRYTDPFGDTEGVLDKSENLLEFTAGGFTGFYGVKRTKDTYSLVSGYLDRRTDTANLGFVVADTLYRSKDPIHSIMPDADGLFFSVRSRRGFSRLGRLSTASSHAESHNSDRGPRIEWIGEFRGYVEDFTRSNGRFYLNLRTRHRIGRLYHFYPGSPPGTGGIQGRLTSSNPRELSGIVLRVDPGGQFTRTERAGQFSFSEVPSGYVELDPPSYQYHFSYPMDLPVHAGEYTVRQAIPMAQQEELLLLDRGLKYFNRGDWNNARIPLEAFRELTQEGPYYRWTDAYMEVIYRKKGDTQAQFELFERRPELFSAPELLALYEDLSDTRKRRTVLKTFDSVLDPYLRRMVRNELEILSKDRSIPRTLNRPVLSRKTRGLPRLQYPLEGRESE